MDTTNNDTQPVVPRHVYIGVGCGVLSLITALFAIAYYVCVGLGYFTEPPRGLTPIWTTVIGLLAMVPIGMWCAYLAARPLHRRLDRQEAQFEQLRNDVLAAVNQLGGEALEAARNAGKWEGFTTGIRDADAGEVVKFPRRSG